MDQAWKRAETSQCVWCGNDFVPQMESDPFGVLAFCSCCGKRYLVGRLAPTEWDMQVECRRLVETGAVAPGVIVVARTEKWSAAVEKRSDTTY